MPTRGRTLVGWKTRSYGCAGSVNAMEVAKIKVKTKSRTTGSVLLMAILLVSAFSVLMTPVSAAPVPEDDVRDAIDLARGYLDGLYKGLVEGDGVNGEYYALPLRVQYLTPPYEWTMPGELGEDTWIEAIYENSQWSKGVYHFEAPGGQADSPEVEVYISWNWGSQSRFRFKHLDHNISPCTALYLYTTYITTLCNSTVGNYYYKYIDKDDLRDVLKSFRYTVRHGTQMGYKVARGVTGWDDSKETDLWRTGNDLGFTYDVYDPAFYASVDEDEQYFYTNQAYRDCDLDYRDFPESSTAYAYRSRICLDEFFGLVRAAYIAQSACDIGLLSQTVNYLTYNHDPDEWEYYANSYVPPIGDCWILPGGGHSMDARSHARYFEAERWNGYGISIWLPFFGDDTQASGVRTALFAIMETIIGYEYGDATSKSYADQAIQALLDVQIPANGWFTTHDEGTVYRPAQAGGFFLMWNQYEYLSQKSLLQQGIDWVCLYQPLVNCNRPEADGIIPSNAETTMMALRALEVYLERAYPTKPITEDATPAPIVDFAEQEFFDSGWSRVTKDLSIPSTATWTFQLKARTETDGYARYLRLYIDGSFKQSWTVSGETNNVQYSMYLTSGAHSIGIVLTTYDYLNDPDVSWTVTVVHDR